MLTMTVIAQVKPEKQQEFRHAIGSLYSTREEEERGLKKSTLYPEVDDPRGFRPITEWETQKDLEEYLRAEKFRVLFSTLQVLCAKPEIRYSHLAEKGKEVLESEP